MSGRLTRSLIRLGLIPALVWVLLSATSCDGNVYVGVTAVPGPYMGYPYGGYPPYGGGGVWVGRPF